MSYQPYHELSETGVEWFPRLPSHWRFTSLKHVVDPLRPITYGIVQAGPHDPEGVPYVRPIDMKDEGGVSSLDMLLRTSPEIAHAYSRSTVRAGDIICSIGPSFGKVMMTPPWLDGANLTQGTARVAVRDSNDARFVFWLLRASTSLAQWESSVGGATFGALNLGPLAETLVPLPPADEQSCIASFLDRETAKIDALIAEQQRLMELLQEKRQAVISHAVTKGLNPAAPMKPSGVEWLGDVPAHWEVKRMKHVGQAIIGLTYTPDDIVDESRGVLVLRASNVQNGKIVLDDNVYVSRAIPAELITRTGDILVCSRNGSRALIGKNAVIDDSTAGLTFGAFMTVLRSSHSDYLACVLNSPLFEYQAGAFMTSTINQLTVGVLENMEVPFPPAAERSAIATHLRRESLRFNALMAEMTSAINTLRERRSALITAAVTGQIDVGSAVKSEAA